MKPVFRSVLLACVCLLAACQALQPPKLYAGETQGALALPFDAAWTRSVAFFAENRIPVSVLDKNSGFIAANDLAFRRQAVIGGRCGWHPCTSGPSSA